jgi:hypothetical protein
MDPSAGGYYVLAITPVDPSVDVGDFDSIRPEAGTVSWEYVDYKPLPDGVDVSTGVEVTMFYRANENDFYVHGDFETAPGNTYAQDDRVILFLGSVDEETLGYELDGLVFKVRFGSGSNIAIEPENPSIQMPGELRLNSPTNTKLYKIDSSYVADTSDGDGDGVPDTWDAFPNDATKVYDSDGDGVADSDDAFPLDSARSEALAGLVAPGNEVTLYYDANASERAESNGNASSLSATPSPSLSYTLVASFGNASHVSGTPSPSPSLVSAT